MGAETRLANGLIDSAAFAYEDASFDDDGMGSGSAERFLLGLGLGRDLGADRVMAGLSGGISNATTRRGVMTPDGTRTAKGSHDTRFVALSLHGLRQFDYGARSRFSNAYLRTASEATLIHQWQDSYTESGASAYSARIDSVANTYLTMNPYLELGGERLVQATAIRPYLRAGALGIIGNTEDLGAGLSGAVDGGPTFAISEDMPCVFADLGLGLGIESRNLLFRLSGTALSADDQRSLAAAAELAVRF